MKRRIYPNHVNFFYLRGDHVRVTVADNVSGKNERFSHNIDFDSEQEAETWYNNF